MKKRRVYALAALGVASILSLALVYAVFTLGYNKGANTGAAAPALVSDSSAGSAAAPMSAIDAVARSGSGLAEGIEVHGHWVIEVKDPDGKTVERREFDNALNNIGAEALSRILARQQILIEWFVNISGSEGMSPCLLLGPFRCIITEFTAGPALFPTLEATVDDTVQFNQKLVLNGTATAQRNGNITSVGTQVRTCTASVTGTFCQTNPSSGFKYPFTGTVLPSPVDVLQGQEIQVTVTISFF